MEALLVFYDSCSVDLDKNVIWKIFTLATRNIENEKGAEEVEDTVEYEEFEK